MVMLLGNGQRLCDKAPDAAIRDGCFAQGSAEALRKIKAQLFGERCAVLLVGYRPHKLQSNRWFGRSGFVVKPPRSPSYDSNLLRTMQEHFYCASDLRGTTLAELLVFDVSFARLGFRRPP